MKTLLLFLLLSLATFAQTKDARFPIKTNVLEIDTELIASAEIYTDYAEIIFYEKEMKAHLFFFLTEKEFQAIAEIVTNYTMQDQEVLSLNMQYGGKIIIRFNRKKGYVWSAMYVSILGVTYEFPVLNRLQYRRLFVHPITAKK